MPGLLLGQIIDWWHVALTEGDNARALLFPLLDLLGTLAALTGEGGADGVPVLTSSSSLVTPLDPPSSSSSSSLSSSSGAPGAESDASASLLVARFRLRPRSTSLRASPLLAAGLEDDDCPCC